MIEVRLIRVVDVGTVILEIGDAVMVAVGWCGGGRRRRGRRRCHEVEQIALALVAARLRLQQLLVHRLHAGDRAGDVGLCFDGGMRRRRGGGRRGRVIRPQIGGEYVNGRHRDDDERHCCPGLPVHPVHHNCFIATGVVSRKRVFNWRLSDKS